MDLNGQLKQYLEVRDGERAKKEQQDLNDCMYFLSKQMKRKVKEMMKEGTNYIILEFEKEMMPYFFKLNMNKIADKAGIDWELISKREWYEEIKEIHITFNVPTKV